MWRSAIHIALKFGICLLFFTAIGIIVWQNTVARTLQSSNEVFPDFFGGPRGWIAYLLAWSSGSVHGNLVSGWSMSTEMLLWVAFIASVVGLSALMTCLPFLGKAAGEMDREALVQ